MLALRRRLSMIVDRAGAAAGMLRLSAAGLSPWLTVLTWHRVAPRLDGAPDFGLVDGLAEELEEQLRVLREYFRFVSVEDVRRWMRGGALPANPLLLTFDDGYRDCLDVAMPVLARHGAPAVFFVATAYVTERRPFWWDRVTYVIARSTRERIELDRPRAVLDRAASPNVALSKALRLVKDTPGLDLERFLDDLTRASDVSWSSEMERSMADRLVLTWDQVRALRSAGMSIGSHTRTHRVLRTVPPSQLGAELEGSRADLERELGERVLAMSYPNGEAIVASTALADAVRDAGYAIAFTNTGGINPRWPRRHPLDLQRIPMEVGLSNARLRAMLALPFLV